MLQFLRDLFDPLFNIMGFTLQTFHGWGAPWWLSIAMLTVVVRTLLFPLTIRQVKSMRKIQDLKPAVDELREEHKDDPQMLQQEMMKLYRERGANPLGGCLPIFVQLPIFLVLYYTIREFDKLESFRTEPRARTEAACRTQRLCRSTRRSHGIRAVLRRRFAGVVARPEPGLPGRHPVGLMESYHRE